MPRFLRHRVLITLGSDTVNMNSGTLDHGYRRTYTTGYGISIIVLVTPRPAIRSSSIDKNKRLCLHALA